MGMGGINGAPSAIATESENEPGANPMPIRGVASPTSPEGAIRKVASRAGAAPVVAKR